MPGQTLAAIITLGLGIGITTTEFSLLYGLFYRGLPFEDGDRIAFLSQGECCGEARVTGSDHGGVHAEISGEGSGHPGRWIHPWTDGIVLRHGVDLLVYGRRSS